MKRLYSEFQYLSALRLGDTLDQEQVYRACIAVANNGLRLPEEQSLSAEARGLLDVRRLLHQGQLNQVLQKLLLMKKLNLKSYLEADRQFLHGQCLARQGSLLEATKQMFTASSLMEKNGDTYRLLRARANALIYTADLTTCIYGELYALEQEVRREQYYEIAANICRTRAIELLKVGRFTEAAQHALESVSLYQLDGYPDDKAVSIYIAAIATLLGGDAQKAREIRSQALIADGKTTTYLRAYESLQNGKTPQLTHGHPIYGTNWKSTSVKVKSIPGKILQVLQSGPATRDELITKVWGENALDPSYCSRLYSAIRYLKIEKKISIIFDGEMYRAADGF